MAASVDCFTETDQMDTQASSPLFGALDIFAQFFIHPLFREDSLLRELNAIHAEFLKTSLNDDWRLLQLD
jgi:insulysin